MGAAVHVIRALEFRSDRARWGISGALYSQSALARPKARLRVVAFEASTPRAVLTVRSRAMRVREPGQIRKEAALSGAGQVPRISLTRASHGGHARKTTLEDEPARSILRLASPGAPEGARGAGSLSRTRRRRSAAGGVWSTSWRAAKAARRGRPLAPSSSTTTRSPAATSARSASPSPLTSPTEIFAALKSKPHRRVDEARVLHVLVDPC